MDTKPINISEKLAKFSEHWSPKIVAQLNDYHFKIAKIEGALDWHKHEDTDEMFFVIDGTMHIDFRESSVELRTGEMFVVPKGKEHKTRAELECSIMIVEPAGTTKTDDSNSESGVWI